MLIKRVKTLNKVKIAKPKTITNSAAKNVHTYLCISLFSKITSKKSRNRFAAKCRGKRTL